MRISGREQGIHEGTEQGGEEVAIKKQISKYTDVLTQGHRDMYTRIFTRYWLMNYSISTQ